MEILQFLTSVLLLVPPFTLSDLKKCVIFSYPKVRTDLILLLNENSSDLFSRP